MQLDEQNLSHIFRLNQRGGRSLSIVDLMADGTINTDMAALCWLAIDRGHSLLTGAVPGGAGKTTLMGALLAFLPPGEQIATVSDPSVTQRAREGDYGDEVCLLAHEIGAGSWFAYIWGRHAADFFAARRAGCRCVSCLHADTPDQAADILRSCGVAERDIGGVGLQLYMWMEGSFMRRIRRVNSLHLNLAGGLQTVWRWQRDADRFQALLPPENALAHLAHGSQEPVADVHERFGHYREALDDLRRKDVRDFEQVRREVLSVYDSL